jgi:hypothetical protein
MAVSALASTTTSAEALAAGTNRNVVLENSDANAAYVLLGSGTASSSNKSFTLAQNANAFLGRYDGPINVVWAGDGSGSLHVTTYSRG